MTNLEGEDGRVLDLKRIVLKIKIWWRMRDLIYSAYIRCPCGAGLAYKSSLGARGGQWDCSEILLGVADKNKKHTANIPFIFCEIKDEGQPSVKGETTRPSINEVIRGRMG